MIDNTVHFKVKVNRERCPSISPDIGDKLKEFEENGLEISLSELITSAGSHWQGGVLNHLGLGTKVAEVQKAWDN
ncbi:MAG: hypothetical protein M3Y56_06215, partial [Armatimonadota bacterium]|nr:hypothetical protein [Armatimonadota bacterium]